MSISNPKSRTEWPRSARGLLALGITLLAADMTIGLSGFALAASTQSVDTTKSAPVMIKGGHLDWRPAEAFAGGEREGVPSVTVVGGAVEERAGTVRFQSAKGSYDANTDVVTAAYRGAVVLTYPDSTVTLANPTVVIGPAGSALRLNVGVRSTDAARTGAAATTPAAPGAPSAAAAETLCPSPTGTAPTTTATEATPAPSESVSPPVDECATSPGPDEPDDGSGGDSAPSGGVSGDAGGGDSLAKTGSALIPLMALGGAMTVAGGGLMLTARRRAFTAQA